VPCLDRALIEFLRIDTAAGEDKAMGPSTLPQPPVSGTQGGDSKKSRFGRKEKQDKKQPSPHTSLFYRNFTPAYEMVWPMVASRNIWNAIKSFPIAPGEKVLEVGVGTGLALPAYPLHATITGVDLSLEMLAKANERIQSRGWTHVNVLPMNAEQLDFPDASFDVVTSFHVVSVVSDPKKMMSELTRVCRPGGRVLIINHFRSPNPWVARVVDKAGTVTRHLGWRTDVNFQDVIAELPLRMDRVTKPSPMSIFTVMTATRLDV
jgi:phosphatidylethanolamine/phosphatidyl-N-methylethanolamine N-methyltransferase